MDGAAAVAAERRQLRRDAAGRHLPRGLSRPDVPPARGDRPRHARVEPRGGRAAPDFDAREGARGHLLSSTDRTRVRREPQRGIYDRETIDAILDEALFCHLGFVVGKQPYVIPTLHARRGDLLYVHGSSASRMLRHAATGAPMCATVTLLDGLVLAKSVFNHSINYRSVVVLGEAQQLADEAKLEAFRLFTERVAPGRWDEARQPTPTELKATAI